MDQAALESLLSSLIATWENEVVEFKQGRIKTYMGNVSEYIEAKWAELVHPAPSGITQAEVTASTGKADAQRSDRERKRLEAEQRQRRYERTKPLQEKIAALERAIEAMERQKSDIEVLMGRPDFYHDGERVKETTAQYKSLEKELNGHYFRWGELTREMDKILEEFNT